MEKISISAIIPTCNRKNSVAAAIESVLSQTQPVDEIIVVDDGSTADASEVLGKFCASKFKYFYQENKGVIAALNR